MPKVKIRKSEDQLECRSCTFCRPVPDNLAMGFCFGLPPTMMMMPKLDQEGKITGKQLMMMTSEVKLSRPACSYFMPKISRVPALTLGAKRGN